MAYFLVKSHACWTGAKRVTTLLTLTFLDLNGYRLDARSDELADEVKRMAESNPSERVAVLAAGAAWFGARLRRIGPVQSEWRLMHGSHAFGG